MSTSHFLHQINKYIYTHTHTFTETLDCVKRQLDLKHPSLHFTGQALGSMTRSSLVGELKYTNPNGTNGSICYKFHILHTRIKTKDMKSWEVNAIGNRHPHHKARQGPTRFRLFSSAMSNIVHKPIIDSSLKGYSRIAVIQSYTKGIKVSTLTGFSVSGVI